MKKVWFMLAMMVCILASCSDGGSDNPVEPTPKPEEVKTEITIDSGIVSNGLSFGVEGSEQSVSFSVNVNWTLSVASTTSGATWCKASATSGSKGGANVKFTVDENTGYDDRSVSVTIKAGSVSKTFTITQKGADALLVTADKYEVAQEGGQIEIEVKANIDYQMEISETAKSWITEASSRALTTYKHTFDIALNEDAEKREGEITFKSGDKVETVKVYQAGGALILLSQNEYTVSDAGETISVDIKSNVEYGVQMPDVDWITDEASSRGMSSHTLKYVIAPNEGYDSRSAEIIFYDKNSDLKDTLKVVQAQKDAIVISEKNIRVAKEGGTVEVKINTNVDFEVKIPSEVTWVTQTESRALTEKSVFLKIAKNTAEGGRSANITIMNQDSQLSETIMITQQGNISVVTLKEAGTMKKLLGEDYLNITSLKVVGPINGDDVYYLRKMLGGSDFSSADWGKLATLDLSEATIVEGGEWYFDRYYTSNDVIGKYMFYECVNLRNIVLPEGVTSIGENAFIRCKALISIIIPDSVTGIGDCAFQFCSSLTSINIPENLTSIGNMVFYDCKALTDVYITNITAWYKINFETSNSNPLSYGAKLYLNNKEITDLVIPDDVTIIRDYTFDGCGTIQSVQIHDGVTEIGSYAFRGCSSLKSVTIGNGVTKINSFAFSGCSSLKSITIGNGVTLIKNSAFKGASIEECHCYATSPPYLSHTYHIGNYKNSDQAFNGAVEEDAVLYVPARSGTAYKSSSWGDYFKIIKEMD